MREIFLTLAFLTVCGFAFSDDMTVEKKLEWTWSGNQDFRKAQMRGFVTDFFGTCSPNKRMAALKLVDVVVESSYRANINPAIVGAIITLESSWNPDAVGKLGEVGLMQINGGISKKATVHEQLDAGLQLLNLSYQRCGTIIGALSLYATGQSCREYRGAHLRIAYAKRIEGYK